MFFFFLSVVCLSVCLFYACFWHVGKKMALIIFQKMSAYLSPSHQAPNLLGPHLLGPHLPGPHLLGPHLLGPNPRGPHLLGPDHALNLHKLQLSGSNNNKQIDTSMTANTTFIRINFVNIYLYVLLTLFMPFCQVIMIIVCVKMTIIIINKKNQEACYTTQTSQWLPIN